MKEASQKLEKKYGKYGYIKVRGNGMTEFVLKKIDSFEKNISGKTMKNINQSNSKKISKTRKNRKK